MKANLKMILMLIMIMGVMMSYSIENNSGENYNKLTDAEKYVIEQKGTERPFTGKYDKHSEAGEYSCKKCGQKLFESGDKFDSSCGWPSFDEAIPGAVTEKLDRDGRRTEIVCSNCDGHLGHVFRGEGLTDKNTRHCVNSISLNFAPKTDMMEIAPINLEPKTEKAYFAGGCFWGVEHYFAKLDGVLETSVGYTGGKLKNPGYRDVTGGLSGHAEALEIEFDPDQVSYETLAKLFFEIHDPTQINRQGPDIGHQYRSAVFYANEEQKLVTEKLIKILEGKGYEIETEVVAATEFYDAEDYHQDYYAKKGSQPYCHFYTKRF